MSYTFKKIRFDLLLLVVMVCFFLPYFDETRVRVDVVMEIAAIIVVGFLVGCSPRFFASLDVRTLLKFAFLSLGYISFRFACDLGVDPKVYVYQIHVLGGICIYILFRMVIRNHDPVTVLKTFIALTVPINLYGLAQWFYPNSVFVQSALLNYGGMQNEEYNYARTTIANLASVEVMSSAAMTSLFSGKHTYAQFALLSYAASFSYFKRTGQSLLVLVGFASALIGGLLTFSKLFIFGLPLFHLINFSVFNRTKKSLLTNLFMSMVLVVILAVLSNTNFLDRAYVLRDILTALLSGDLFSLLNSRYGDNGYLTENNDIFSNVTTWIFGLGFSAGEYKISDNQYRSLILLGGLPYVILFLAPIIVLQNDVVKISKKIRWISPFATYGFILFVCGLGVETYWQPRVTSLWIFLLLVLMQPLKNSSDVSIKCTDTAISG